MSKVLTHIDGHVLTVTINRPEARNAFNLAVAQGLADAMDELDDTPELSVAIVTPFETSRALTRARSEKSHVIVAASIAITSAFSAARRPIAAVPP